MVLLIEQKYKCGQTSYLLQTDGTTVATPVIVRSELDCEAGMEVLAAQCEAGEITAFLCEQLIENSYTTTKKETYFINDPSLRNTINVAEVIAYMDLWEIPNDFLPTDTTVQAIQKMAALGYYFNLPIKGNINE